MEKREFQIPWFFNKLSSQLFQLQQNGQFCDAVIATSGGLINVHKLILLASKSPVLMANIQEAEKAGGPLCLIHIDAQNLDMQLFIRALYTGKVELDLESAEKMIRICEMLKLKDELEFYEEVRRDFCKTKTKHEGDTDNQDGVTFLSESMNVQIANTETGRQEVMDIDEETCDDLENSEVLKTSIINVANDGCNDKTNDRHSMDMEKEINLKSQTSKLDTLNADSLDTSLLEGSMCEPCDKHVSSDNNFAMTELPKGSMDEPVLTKGSMDEPVLTKGSMDEPEHVLSKGSMDEPVLPKGSTDEPVLTKGSMDEPVLTKGSMDEPVHVLSKGSSDEPVLPKGSKDESVLSKGFTDGPAMSKGSMDEPVLLKHSKDEKVVLKGSTEQPVLLTGSVAEPIQIDVSLENKVKLSKRGEHPETESWQEPLTSKENCQIIFVNSNEADIINVKNASENSKVSDNMLEKENSGILDIIDLTQDLQETGDGEREIVIEENLQKNISSNEVKKEDYTGGRKNTLCIQEDSSDVIVNFLKSDICKTNVQVSEESVLSVSVDKSRNVKEMKTVQEVSLLKFNKQISGMEDVSPDEDCESISDISYDELPDLVAEGKEILTKHHKKIPVEYDNVSDFESVSEELDDVVYENVSDDSSKADKFPYDVVSENSMDKTDIVYEVISDGSNDEFPIEYEVISDLSSSDLGEECNKENKDSSCSKSSSEMSMKTVDEENFDSDDDVAIIRCYKCTANFIDRDLYQEHVQEHEKDEFDAYKYRINTYDEYDAYNYKGPEAEGELDTSKEELQIPTIKCDECEEKFVSMIAFDDHCMYHKRQKVLEKLSKIEEALDKEKASDDKDDDSNLSVISSLSASDGDNPFSRKRSHSSESKTPFEQYSSYKRPPSREKSLERDFFRHSRERSLSSVSDSYHRYNRSRSRDRRSISTESFSRDSYYNSRFYSHHKRKRSSSLEHARKRGTRASHRSRYRDRSWSRSISRSRSRSRSRARSESWSSSDSSYRSYSSRRSRSFESISSDSGVSPSNIKGRDDIEKNLESALEEMAADYIEEEDKPLEKREKSPARKKSIDTFDWLASLQNPSQKRKKKREQKGKGKKKKYKEDQAAKSTRVEVKKQMVLPSNISYTPVTVAQVPIPQPIMMPQVAQVTASTPQYNLVQATSLQPIVGISASALPQWALQQSVIQQQTANTPTPLSQFANQQQSNLYKKSTVSNTTRHNLVSIQPTHFTTPTSTAAPIKGILKNVIKTTTTAVMQTIITPSISSSSRQLVQVQLAGPQFCGSKALTDMVQYGQQPTTSSQSVDLQPSHSQATKEIIQSTEFSNKSVPFTVSKVPQEPQIIPRPEKPMKRPIKIELGAESEETDEQFEPTGGKWDTVTMFFELTAEEEELRKKELVKDRFLLIQKSKLTSEPERSKLLKEIQRLKLIVHKLYHELVKCPTCDFHTRDPREYNRHQRTRCGNRLICHHCELTFVSQEETQAHLLTHKKICSLCSQIFYNESKYSEHIERHKKNIT